MITPITSIARLAWQTRAVSVPLLVAGAQKSKDAELSFAGAGQDYLGS